jgi:2-polyprenyl-3-methyl-5-hydroxy-6-metoxy-1,4-benzoquinol methylase
MSGGAGAICPVNGRPGRPYCAKEGAKYYIEPLSGTIFQSPLPTIAEMTSYVDQAYASGAYRRYAEARDLKIATARQRVARIKAVARGRRLLDVGCSCGFFLEAAADGGLDVSGVEISSAAISMARADIRARIVHGDVNVLIGRSERRFDIVTAFDIIEHTYDPARFLREIRAILEPGGLLVVSTPDTGHPLRRLMGRSWPMLQPLQHTVLFSRKGIAELLQAVGFRVIAVESAFKTVTIDYLGEQLAATNAGLHRLFRAARNLVPARARQAPIGVNIGEFMVFAEPSPEGSSRTGA